MLRSLQVGAMRRKSRYLCGAMASIGNWQVGMSDFPRICRRRLSDSGGWQTTYKSASRINRVKSGDGNYCVIRSSRLVKATVWITLSNAQIMAG